MITDTKPELVILPLTELQESPTNPRKSFSPSDLAEMAKSITEQGVVQPIVVRPNPRKGLGYEIVAGARRFRASRLAGLSEIPAVVRTLSDAQVITIQIIENLQRVDVHPLDEAEGYQTLARVTKNEPKEIAARVGKSLSYLYQRLKLLELIEPAKKAFRDDKITAGHAILIARLTPKDQQAALRYTTDAGGPRVSVRNLAEHIEDSYQLELARAPFPLDDARLCPELGACLSCTRRSGFVPELFPEIKKGDVCTDRVCYESKVTATINKVKAAYKAQDKELLPLSSQSHYSAPKGVLGNDQYKILPTAAKVCPGTREGIIVDAYRFGDAKRGDMLKVCTKGEKCPVHGLTQKDRDERHQMRTGKTRAGALQEKALNQAREAARAQIVPKVKGDLATLRWLAQILTGYMAHEALKRTADRRGWKPTKPKYGPPDYEAPAVQAVAKMTQAELCQFLAELAISGWNEAELQQAAKRYRVDLAGMARRALAQLKADAKAKEKPKASPKAKALAQTSAKRAKPDRQAKAKAKK